MNLLQLKLKALTTRCLELFSGIGGFAAAAEQLGWRVAGAIDINKNAAAVYRMNFAHPVQVREIESLRPADLLRFEADFWWMSPPCQPFTRRGVQRDLADARTAAFQRLLQLISQLQPGMLAMENVPGFRTSRAADKLREILVENRYAWREFELCPSEFGIPNRRKRFFLTAAKDRELIMPRVPMVPRRLSEFVSQSSNEKLFVDGSIDEYAEAIDCVDPCCPQAVAACFTSAYGKSPIRSGSYLQVGRRLRRFAPNEILSLLGFPAGFELPADLTLRQAWKLVGNSLSVPVVKHVLSSFAASPRRSLGCV